MKTLLFACLAAMLLVTADAQVKLPSPSPTQLIKQEFGLGYITVTYSRPAAKGHKVFGDLVPYGKLWPTAPLANTQLNFSEPVEINGRRIDSGSYVLYIIPGLESWEIIINKGIKNKSPEAYKESEDVLRFKIYSTKTRLKTESFTIQFADVKAESCELQLLWEKKAITIPVRAIIIDKLRAQLDAAMQTEERPYWQAAQFYYEFDKNLNKALENANKATQANPKAYWIFLYKAKIQHEMGDITGAMQSSQISADLSKDAKNEDYVKMNKQLQKELKIK